MYWAMRVGSSTWSDGISAISFNVKKQALTVTASDLSKVYGDANPALTYTITGYAPGEDESVLSSIPVVTTAADANSNAGTHALLHFQLKQLMVVGVMKWFMLMVL